MVVALIAFSPWAMNGEIDGHPETLGQGSTKLRGEVQPLLVGQLGGKSNNPLAGSPSVLPLLGCFGPVPQGIALASLTVWRDDSGCYDTTPPRVVVSIAGPIINQRRAGPIRSGGDSRSPVLPRYWFGFGAIQGHGSAPRWG
ncbi:hypothetical protein HK14_05430 [Acetobacter cibinongensis]|uniref:Uncharacterized protein n=1 Tax=Acetobacter cibinongensis TaxID=146475 RepID=A0A1Z5YV31_9PROT|nr:hypothetical protein HK14_05430 [Acetobacter cibinongensis]